MRNYPKYVTAALLIGAIALLLSACASNQKTESDSFFKDWQMKAESARGYSPSVESAEVSVSEQTNPSFSELEEAPLPEEIPLPTDKISLTLHDTPVAVVLRALAKAAGQSIIINSSVEGTANVNAVDMPWDTVFLGILKTYGLTYERTGEILRITTLDDLAKEWERDNAKLRQKALSQQLKEAGDFETKIFFIRYTDGAALGKVLEGLMGQTLQAAATPTSAEAGVATATGSSTGQPSLTVDEANNAVIVHAPSKTIRQLAGVILKLDRPTTQVLIEAQIVETTQDTARNLGVQWGGLNYEENGDTLNWIGGPMPASGALFAEDGTPITQQPSSGNIINFPAELKDAAGATLGYQLQNLASNYILTAQLSALQEEGKLNILSSPSITTLDNQAASIESGREVPFQTVTGTGTNATASIEFKKAVLSLKVTPHTIDQKSLRLNVVTHKDELDFTNAVQGNPTIITKNAETNVILYDGQTMVIGGLSKETAGDSESGVPLLKDLPIFGHLFKSTGTNRNMEEVLIFITPHILKEKSVSEPDGEKASE